MGLEKYFAGSGKKCEFSDVSTNDDQPKKQCSKISKVV